MVDVLRSSDGDYNQVQQMSYEKNKKFHSCGFVFHAVCCDGLGAVEGDYGTVTDDTNQPLPGVAVVIPGPRLAR